jgi:hypothetical protein
MVGVEEAADVVFDEAVLSPEEVVEVQVELLWGGAPADLPALRGHPG